MVKKSILDDLAILGKKSGLKSFELVSEPIVEMLHLLWQASSQADQFTRSSLQLKDIECHDELFSVENGLLTPTLKTKRPECRKTFAKQLSDMYRTLQ